MVKKQLIVAVEGSAALGPYWKTILSDYLEKIIRSFCQKKDIPHQLPVSFELALVVFTSHGSRCASLIQRSGWTTDVDIFLQWLLEIPFGVGGFNKAAIAEALAEALMMFDPIPNRSQTQQNVEVNKHCVLVSANDPHDYCWRSFYLRKFQSSENKNVEAEAERSTAIARKIAKSYSQGFVSLSVICPRQLPKLRTIFNAGKLDPKSPEPDPPVTKRNEYNFLVLVSENFMEARAAIRGPGVSTLPSTPNPVNMDIAQTISVHGSPPASVPAGVTSMTGSGTVAAQVAQNPGLGSFATATSNLSRNSSLRMPQATRNLQVPASSIGGGNNLGSIMLDGDNYESWCRRVTTILTDQKLIEHIRKSMSCPEVGLTKEVAYAYFRWEQDDQKAREILLGEMEKEIRDEFDAHKETKELWDALFLRFGKCLASQLRPLITALDTCMKNKDLSVSEKVRNLLDMAKPLDMSEQKLHEWDKIQAILQILPESWAATKTWLTMTLPILDLETVVRVIEAEEARQMDESDTASNSTQVGVAGSKRKRNDEP